MTQYYTSDIDLINPNNSDNIWFNLILSFLNFILLYFIMHNFIFSRYPILYEFLCGYDTKASYNRKLNPQEEMSFDKCVKEVCNNYSHFRLRNILYFSVIFIIHVIILIVFENYVFIVALDVLSIFVFIAFMNIFVETSCNVDRMCLIFDNLSKLVGRGEIQNKPVGKIVFDAMGPKVDNTNKDTINDYKTSKDDINDKIGVNKDKLPDGWDKIILVFINLSLEYVNCSKTIENKINEIQSIAILYLFGCMIFSIITCFVYLYPPAGLYLYTDHDGDLIAYRFYPNSYHEHLIDKDGFIKLCIRLDVSLKSCIEMPKKGTCIEFTVTKGKDDDYDITYVVFENGVQVEDKFNLKRFKRGDSIIDIIGNTEA